MSALVHLIRHARHAELGDVLSGRSDIGLSPEGRHQAEALGRWAAARPIGAVFSSPRRRACETAGALGLPVSVDERLDEIDFGLWTGRPFAQLAADPDWTRWNEAREAARPPEGETMAAATARAVACVEARSAAATPGPVVLVSHCDIIRGVVAHYLGLSLDRLLAFDVDPASVTTLSVGGWGGRLVQLNERPA
ncbi:histidine phosphatase family protein [Sphingomonas morindae]|uniref:Histidine phosphatase family protein n=1 Tax=Sphingomonas morindae TaxID=1541170 RepID=A0ABY4XAJ5_9SPHN|nr:histidine phosphatase family protein [Sphingomonas morindae]USI73849.1 histidine phosphatase family protein [Sphingomonas morindae]